MSEFTTMKKIRYWCYKILPLTYDDSLSYYEVLSKIVNKVNELIENNNNIPDEIREAISEGGYLDNLEEQIASANDKSSTTATADRTKGQLIWLNGYLYRITRNMLAGDQYTESSEGATGNIEKITIEEWIDRFSGFIKNAITDNDEEYNVLSSKAYSTGALLWWQGELYRATTDIVTNANLLIDTNLESINIETLLNNIQNQLADDELYPIYTSANEHLLFKGTLGAGTVVTGGDVHTYDSSAETMKITKG